MVTGYYPETIDELLTVLNRKEAHKIICGGSDLMVTKKIAPNMIFVNQIDALREIKEDRTIVSIGAACVYREMIHSPIIPKILQEAMKQIASPAIRNVGSIGGNICNASPAGDTLPVLYAMDAIIVKASMDIEGKICRTRVPISDFILGIRQIALAQNEAVVAIEIPKASFENMTYAQFKKLGGRETSAISKLSFAGLMRIENEKILDVRLAFGSVGVTTIRNKEAENEMLQLGVDELPNKKKEIIAMYDKLITPIDDQRSTANYRKKVCLNLLEDFLTLG
jgi:CO/xanthine dehydrogenase FAD-binding subunit